MLDSDQEQALYAARQYRTLVTPRGTLRLLNVYVTPRNPLTVSNEALRDAA